jgi:hypothetical protein
MDNVCGLDYISIQFEILQVDLMCFSLSLWLLWWWPSHQLFMQIIMLITYIHTCIKHQIISTWIPPISTQRRLATHCVLFSDSLYTLSIINTGTYANNGQGISFSSSLLQRHIIYWWITLARYWHISSEFLCCLLPGLFTSRDICRNLLAFQHRLYVSCYTVWYLAFTELGRLHL